MGMREHPDVVEAPPSTDWPLPYGQMVHTRRLIERLIEWEPNSPLNVHRQRVLDNWPNIRPVLYR